MRTDIRYLRPEVIGPDGKKAWGQPIFLDGGEADEWIINHQIVPTP